MGAEWLKAFRCLPCDGVTDCVPRLSTPASQESIGPYFASPGNDQNPKSEAWFLLNANDFPTIVKLKNCKWNHQKSETICNCT